MQTAIGKAVSLARVLRRDPREFADRVAAIVAGRADGWRPRPRYDTVTWEQLSAQLPPALRPAYEGALHEAALSRVEAAVAQRAGTCAGDGIDPRHDGDVLLARCCYALVRAARPRTLLETGVAHGVTTAYMLAALHENGAGDLHSIDVPPHDAGAAEQVGAFVPDGLRARWQLHYGMSHRVLPRVLAALRTVDFFLHDSLHTYANMTFEFRAIWPHLRAGGVVVSDDVEGNRAFLELRDREPSCHVTCSAAGKPALFGVALK
ncbi:MAG TPA: class I SAM-dependent methyltransferase [Longimicrobiales bacterium]|nr:class I SAM-dependent methyltransferase [Longimicrobiales bacterium]